METHTKYKVLQPQLDQDEKVIRTADLRSYVEVLRRKLGLTTEQCNQLNTMAYATSKQLLVLEVNYSTEFDSSFGFIYMTKNSYNNLITISYAIHRLHFNLEAYQRVERKRMAYFLYIIPIGTETVVTDEYVPARLSTRDVDLIKNTYMCYKALEAMLDQGVISEIRFEK